MAEDPAMDPLAEPRQAPSSHSSKLEPDDSLASRLVDRLVAAWQRGDRPRAEEILADHPDLDDEATLRVVFEESCLRGEAGLEVDRADYARRFPHLWPDLELLLDCQLLMEPASKLADFPAEGEELAGFRLLAELGRGGQGRVFLASELALADRPVVLKVTPLGREEHLSLARFQHMHIVPLYSARVLPDRRLQVLCMPFLGGGSLARVLELLKDEEPARRTGGLLIEALDRLQEGLPVGLTARGPFRQYIARSSYVEAVCWVGICLADGLQYAHERNFVHMDIKPSNVLIAGDGQPMLLDFHLAREPISPGEPPPDHVGGTPGHLAPEQEQLMAAVREGRPVPARVDGRADLYALGLVLNEALGGRNPEATGGARDPLRRRNPRVSVGLSDIICKCLQHDPDDRYSDAASLAADLRRLLDGQPLRGVPNRSPSERWRNWRRRRPHSLARLLVLLASVLTAAAASALLLAGYLQRVREVEANLAAARGYVERHQYPDASRALKKGLALAEHLPAVEAERGELADELARVERLAKVDELHRLVELVRFRYGVDPPGPEEARGLIVRSGALWRDRKVILGTPGDRPNPSVAWDVRGDLYDLALARADLFASHTPKDEAKREALQVLDEAEELLGPNPALDRQRVLYAATPGGSARPASPPLSPTSASDHLDLGKSYLRTGEDDLAAQQFQLGLDLRPEDFWLNFYQGLCSYRRKRFEESAEAFRVCIALSPASAECFHNRALALAALGSTVKAIEHYSRALELNPSLFEARLNRGMLRYRKGRLAEAGDDLRQALVIAVRPKDLGIIRYNLALVDLAKGDRKAALANLERASVDGDAAARALLDRLEK